MKMKPVPDKFYINVFANKLNGSPDLPGSIAVDLDFYLADLEH